MAAIENSKSEVNESAIQYEARTALADLANEIVASRSLEKPEIIALIKRAAKIRYWLKALDYKDFLTKVQRERIWYKLIEISQIYNFPTAPILGDRTRPSILTGVPGPEGPEGPINTSVGTPYVNTDVDIGTEVVDSFAFTTGTGATWYYIVSNGTAQRRGTISGTWLADGSSWSAGDDSSTAEIGDTSGVSLDIDITGGNVRLLATVTSNNWIIKGTRLTD